MEKAHFRYGGEQNTYKLLGGGGGGPEGKRPLGRPRSIRDYDINNRSKKNGRLSTVHMTSVV
jgi:hypothetical protein